MNAEREIDWGLEGSGKSPFNVTKGNESRRRLSSAHQTAVDVHQLRHAVNLPRETLLAVHDVPRCRDDAELMCKASVVVALPVEPDDPLALRRLQRRMAATRALVEATPRLAGCERH